MKTEVKQLKSPRLRLWSTRLKENPVAWAVPAKISITYELPMNY